MEAYLDDRRAQLGLEGKSTALADCVFDKEEIELDIMQPDNLELAIPKLDDSKAKV